MSHPARSTLEPPDYDGHFVMIPLTRGKFAIVDEGEAEPILSRGQWYPAKQRALLTCYASRAEGTPAKTVLMHWLIAGCKRVDHVNRNGLDNRRINLRPATPSQNNANRPPQRNNTSGYKGVRLRRGKWQASVGFRGARTYLGSFDDPADAARAYNRAALEIYGEFAWLNPV